MADKNQLFAVLTSQFNLEEIDTLCFRLSIDHQNVPGNTKDAKARELVDYCWRYAMIDQLEKAISELRPPALIESKQSQSRTIRDLSSWLPITILTTIYISLIFSLYLPVTFQGNPACLTGRSGLIFSLWSNVDLFVPMIAGIYGLYRLRPQSNALGQPQQIAFRLLTIGVVAWAFGEVIWMTYNFIIGVEIPYPSLADVAYITHGLLEFVFACILWIASRDAARGRGYISSTVITLLILLNLFVTYALRYSRYPLQDDPVKLIFDIAYPSLHALSFGLVLGVVLSSSYRMQISRVQIAIVLVLIGFGVMYFADATFAATTSLDECTQFSYYNGNWVELLFTTAFWLVGVGIAVLPDRQ